MSLKLGKELNRCYSIRQPFLNYHYIVSVFFNATSNFLLFKVDNSQDDNFSNDSSHGIKINMFKNLRASKFCSTFLNLHNYRNENLDIVCQFDSIKDIYTNDTNLLSSENIILNKIKCDNGKKPLNDSITIYSFSFPSYYNEFAFIIAERQHIVKKLKRKVVRSTALQIATSQSINFLEKMSEIDEDSKKKIKKDPFFDDEE